MLYSIVSALALLIIAVTMLVRANDIGRRKGWNWHVRRVGFILAGFAPVGMMLDELFAGRYPTSYEVAFRVGLACVFVTTPYLPPWWKFITRGEVNEDSDGGFGGGRSTDWRQVHK